jgi:3-oxoacyl-[acyl-carrier protein] reductase
MTLLNKITIITGGAKGIGQAAAELFAQHGAIVYIWDMAAEAGQQTAERIRQNNGSCSFQLVSTTSVEAIEQAVNEILSKHGRIDVLVNNAGITRDKSIQKMTHDQWQQVIDVNLTGVFNCAKAVIPHMVSQVYGRIICTSSVVGIHGNFGQTNYAASKAGVIAMCRTWAKELGKYNITANAVAPGFIKTDMTDAIPDEVKLQIVESIPSRRMGLPIDVANCYLFLASEQASYINGQVIGVNGGSAS